ncbi:MAG: hypothetical protein EXS36_07005 [Pedosphaera sp.]|nr:hypothetical protein [Pedosphaera sp.]
MKSSPSLMTWFLSLLACAGLFAFSSVSVGAAAEHDTAAPTVHTDASTATTNTPEGTSDHHEAAPPSLGQQFLYSYLTAYMFCLSIVMGCFFLVLIHHMFDAAWSVPIRRVTEQVACLIPVLGLLALPLLIFAPSVFPWMNIDPATDHALNVKKAWFNRPVWTVILALIFSLWTFMAFRFRSWSIAQDKDGAAIWTRKARVQAAWGIFVFAFTLTAVCFSLMKSLQYQFFSTMYGVYYFAGSVWTTLITMYVVTLWLSQPGRPLEKVIFYRQKHDLAVLFFGFTVFYAYIHFSQYFLIWNAAMPEETFWYVDRERGSWKWVGMLILFGHFIVPFVILLNQDIKHNLAVMLPIAVWAWLMHYVDMTFNVMPVLYPRGLHLTLLDPLCWFGMVVFLGGVFWKNYLKAAPYPLKDPRLLEAITHHEIPAASQPAAHR